MEKKRCHPVMCKQQSHVQSQFKNLNLALSWELMHTVVWRKNEKRMREINKRMPDVE